MDAEFEKITLRQLQIFLAAAEHLSFLRAAEEVGLTPPAVSMQMSRLSESLNAPLFEKSGRQQDLTPAGRALIPYAERITQALREASETISGLQGQIQNTIKLAMVTTSRNFGPHLTAEFQEQNPHIHLDITIANRRTVIERLENNQADLALMGRPPRRIDVDASPFAKHPYVLIAHPDHPLAGRRSIAPSLLIDETFIVREGGSGTRMVHDHFFTDKGLPLPDSKEMDSNENIKQAVMANMGLAFISEHTIALEVEADRLVILNAKGLPEMREWFVIHPKDKELSPAAEIFKRFVAKNGRSFMKSFFA